MRDADSPPPAGQRHHGNVAREQVGPQGPQDGVTVQVGQVNIKQDQLRPLGQGHGQALAGRGRRQQCHHRQQPDPLPALGGEHQQRQERHADGCRRRQAAFQQIVQAARQGRHGEHKQRTKVDKMSHQRLGRRRQTLQQQVVVQRRPLVATAPVEPEPHRRAAQQRQQQRSCHAVRAQAAPECLRAQQARADQGRRRQRDANQQQGKRPERRFTKRGAGRVVVDHCRRHTGRDQPHPDQREQQTGASDPEHAA